MPGILCIMLVVFVRMGGNHIGIISLQKSVSKLHSDLVRFLCRNLSGREGPDKMIGQVFIPPRSLFQSGFEIEFRRCPGAGMGSDEPVIIRLFRIAYVLYRFAYGCLDRMDSCICHIFSRSSFISLISSAYTLPVF